MTARDPDFRLVAQARVRELAKGAYENAQPGANRAGSFVTALTPRSEVRKAFGILPVLMLAGKGAAEGFKFISSEQGKSYLAKLNDDERTAETQYRLASAKAESSKDEATKKRWSDRASRYKDKWETQTVTKQLAEKGILGEGPVLEYRRNLLAMEWEDADDAKKVEIEGKVLAWDARLTGLSREQSLQTSLSGSASVNPVEQAKGRTNLAAVAGKGTLSFRVSSPPGPGRLVRLPFYPQNVANAWSPGIDRPGDSPILALRFGAGDSAIGPFWMQTPQLSYGVYRIVGLQTNRGINYINAFGLDPPWQNKIVAVSLSDLFVYNGQALFMQSDQIDADTFSVLASERDAVRTNASTLRESPYNYNHRRQRFFVGLRDYPVVNENARAQIAVWAFTSAVALGVIGTAIQIPFSCNLVIEILSDRVYGNPRNPGPYARSGAVTKAGALDFGVSSMGRPQLQVVSSRYRKAP